MKNLFLTIIFSFFILGSSLIVKSQSEYCNNLKKNTVYFEFIGNGIFYSINYDRLFEITEKVKLSARIGFHYTDNFIGNDNRLIGSPLEISGLYSIFRKKHFLEVGSGLTIMNNLNYNNNHVENLIILVLRIGYRYQKPNGGLFLKVGFLPMYDMYAFNPNPDIIHNTWFMSGGLGIGYTFK